MIKTSTKAKENKYRVSEQEFIKALKSGSNKAFGELVEKYQGLVTNTCYGFVLNKDDADDLAQEVFVEAYQGLANFREDSKISTWLYRIAINKSIDEIRRKTRKKRLTKLTGLFGKEDRPLSIADNNIPNPEQQLESEERLQILNSAIDKLPGNQAIALRLSKFEGLASKEIAEIMDTSLSSVDSLIHRARANLKKQLYKFYQQEKF
ncbi:MAG: sigma-70 family RNA polymerase sigma factor [Bacteroidota bacterium]|nr:sigma-70 family RNA polymerase sigma factor [Bacteroidota bacterium]